MGANLAKNSGSKKYTNPFANKSINPVFEKKQYEVESPRTPTTGGELMAAPEVAENMGSLTLKEGGQLIIQETADTPNLISGYASSDDEYYDGIPRYKRRPVSQRSRPRRYKVSNVGSLLGRAGSAGLGKAAGVIDSLGSTVTGFNTSSKFVSGATAKSNELSILSFEVANTIVKGSNIMQSLSQGSIRILKEVVFPSQGVQQLVSTDLDDLLNIVAVDKREELKIFSGEVVRFGNYCKDSQWHNLDRFFEKQSRGGIPQKQSQDEAKVVMQQLMVLVQQTAELYRELHTLDKLEQDYQQMRIARFRPNAAERGNDFTALEGEIKSQKKLVRNSKKKSLWSRSMEEVMEKLVDIVLFLNREITVAFETTDFHAAEEKSSSDRQRLGPSGLALHYANIILIIDSIVARPSSLPPLARHTLYQSLPPHIKSSLRSKLHSFHVKEELSITEIKAEMEKTLHWLVPVSTNTAKAHYGFGWVGEWGNTGSEPNRQTVVLSDFIQVEALHHANKSTTEAYILDLLLWLNHLVSKAKVSTMTDNGKQGTKPSNGSLVKQKETKGTRNSPSRTLTTEQQVTLQDVDGLEQTQGGNMMSQDFLSSDEVEILNESNGFSATSGSSGLIPEKQPPSRTPAVDIVLDVAKKLDVIDRVDM